MLSWESISLRATSFPLAGTSDYAAFTNRRTTATWLFAPALLWLVGCGGGPAMAPVTGKITVSGQPATRGSVIFMPDNSKGTTGKGAVGDIGPDGSYTLQTFKTNDGAIVGHHRVVIRGQALGDDEGMPTDQRIPRRYGSPQWSGLTAEVKPGANMIDFDLSP